MAGYMTRQKAPSRNSSLKWASTMSWSSTSAAAPPTSLFLRSLPNPRRRFAHQANRRKRSPPSRRRQYRSCHRSSDRIAAAGARTAFRGPMELSGRALPRHERALPFGFFQSRLRGICSRTRIKPARDHTRRSDRASRDRVDRFGGVFSRMQCGRLNRRELKQD